MGNFLHRLMSYFSRNRLPYLRPAGDGTYEVVVPLADHSPPIILPYAFASEEEGARWIKSRKGTARIEEARRLHAAV